MEETIWTRDSTIIKSAAKIFIDNGPPITIKTSQLSNPFSNLLKEEHKYLPYRNEPRE
jgi:hypothetical protein